jgi:hypothetical protein
LSFVVSGKSVPDQFRIVCDSRRGAVPVFRFFEPFWVTIKKAKVGASIVEVRHRTTIANGWQLSIIKQPDHRNWSRWNCSKFDVRVVIGTHAIEPFIKAVVEKVVLQFRGIASSRI